MADLEFDADFSDIDPDAVEGGNPSRPGWYKAVVHDVGGDSKREGVLLWTFKVTAGPFKGGLIYDRLYDPSMAEDIDKAQGCKKRQALYARRLGLWDGEQKRPHITWTDAIGREVVLHLTENKKTNYVGLAFDGIYPPDHEQIPPDAFGGAPVPNPGPGRKTPPRATAKQPAAPAADPYAGL